MLDQLAPTTTSAARTARRSWMLERGCRTRESSSRSLRRDGEARPCGDHELPVVPVGLPVALPSSRLPSCSAFTTMVLHRRT